MSQSSKRVGKPLPRDTAIFRFMEGTGPCAREEPDLDGGIFCSIMVLNSVIERVGNRLLEAHELTLPQWLALGTVLHAGPDGVPHARLGQKLMLSKAPVTGIVDRLERVGLVKRHADARDRRVSRVVATEAGEAKWFAVRDTLHNGASHNIDEALSENEQLQLLGLLGRLLETFAADDEMVADLVARKNDNSPVRVDAKSESS